MQTEVRTGPPWSRASSSKPIQAQAGRDYGERGQDNSKERVREENQDTELNSHAYLRWGLGDGGPG